MVIPLNVPMEDVGIPLGVPIEDGYSFGRANRG